MKTKITLEFEDGDAQAVADLTKGVDLATLLRDSLGEFHETRTPTIKYVETRYPEYNAKGTGNKLREVDKRKKLADVLRRADVTIEVDGSAS